MIALPQYAQQTGMRGVYTLRRLVIRKVLSKKIWGVPRPAWAVGSYSSGPPDGGNSPNSCWQNLANDEPPKSVAFMRCMEEQMEFGQSENWMGIRRHLSATPVKRGNAQDHVIGHKYSSLFLGTGLPQTRKRKGKSDQGRTQETKLIKDWRRSAVLWLKRQTRTGPNSIRRLALKEDYKASKLNPWTL